MRARALKQVTTFERPKYQKGGRRFVSPNLILGHRKKRGAAIVELALVTPFLMALTLGICELGQAYKVNAILTAASRAGSLTGSRPGCSNLDVTADAKSVISVNGLSTSLATVQIKVNDVTADVASATRNDKVTVTVSVPTSQVIFVNVLAYLNGKPTLSKTTTMMKQG